MPQFDKTGPESEKKWVTITAYAQTTNNKACDWPKNHSPFCDVTHLWFPRAFCKTTTSLLLKTLVVMQVIVWTNEKQLLLGGQR